MANGAGLAALGGGGDQREVNEFDVPDEVRAAGALDLEDRPLLTLGLVVLKAKEELDAHKRGGIGVQLVYELAKQALREVNGAAVSLKDGSADRAWSKIGPQGRALVINAYQDLHGPKEAAVESFLASRKRKVGGG